tara:strand:+ start:68 stop:247 length:180 start_codon:yes stop_codon:yes gene_type:complete
MTPPLDDFERDRMIAYIAEEWVDNIDIKDYLRSMLIEYTDELEGRPDDFIRQEYAALTE